MVTCGDRVAHLFPVVGVVCDEAELLNLWCIDLLVLGGDQHAGDANQLQLVASNWPAGQVAVYVVDCQEDCV